VGRPSSYRGCFAACATKPPCEPKHMTRGIKIKTQFFKHTITVNLDYICGVQQPYHTHLTITIHHLGHVHQSTHWLATIIHAYNNGLILGGHNVDRLILGSHNITSLSHYAALPLAMQHTVAHCHTLPLAMPHTTALPHIHCHTIPVTHCRTILHYRTLLRALSHTAAHYADLSHTAARTAAVYHIAVHCRTAAHCRTDTAHCHVHCRTLESNRLRWRRVDLRFVWLCVLYICLTTLLLNKINSIYLIYLIQLLVK
jgi:hypothetical protein